MYESKPENTIFNGWYDLKDTNANRTFNKILYQAPTDFNILIDMIRDTNRFQRRFFEDCNNKMYTVAQFKNVLYLLENTTLYAKVLEVAKQAKSGSIPELYDNNAKNINDLFPTPYDFAEACEYGEYNFNHDYFTYEVYDNLYSYGRFSQFFSEFQEYILEDFQTIFNQVKVGK